MIADDALAGTADPIGVLPHRPPFLFVDRVLGLDIKAGIVEAERHVPDDEPWTPAHLPGLPLVPGVLLIEGMAQACGILARHLRPEGTARLGGRLAGVRSAKFFKPAIPGSSLRYRGRLVRRCGELYVFDATVTVDTSLVARAELWLFLP